VGAAVAGSADGDGIVMLVGAAVADAVGSAGAVAGARVGAVAAAGVAMLVTTGVGCWPAGALHPAVSAISTIASSRRSGAIIG
jgi:hypothetical protein